MSQACLNIDCFSIYIPALQLFPSKRFLSSFVIDHKFFFHTSFASHLIQEFSSIYIKKR